MDSTKILYIRDRIEWRAWLVDNFDKETEIWLVYPKKSTNKKRILYNDAVEEALCFGWIDSTVKSLDEENTIQRFTPRRSKSSFSQPNKERIRWLLEQGLVHASMLAKAKEIAAEPFVFPQDIIDAIQADEEAWAYFRTCSESYKRIRIAYIDAARKRPEEFKKRLGNFISKTRDGKLIKGHGGIEKFY
jgi:uncharacterized protein YdeI (YjbR/CyaY-like superfamily)